MKTMLIIFVMLGNNTFKVVQDKEMTVDECVNAALTVNQDQSVPFNAACFHVVRKDDKL